MVTTRQRRILIIERSRTLRHSLRGLLAETVTEDFSLELDVVDSFAMARRRLSVSGGRYDGVVFGWPLASTPASDEFILMLGESAFASTFVLVLSHDRIAAARAWASARAASAYVLWNDPPNVQRRLVAGLGGGSETGMNPNHPRGTGGALRMLLVDDSASSRVFFRRLLGTRGYEVDTAASVTEAREKLRHRQYDIALVDYYLPELLGDALVREIKTTSATAELTCAVITSAYSDHLIRDCLDAGAVECLFKNDAGELFLSQIDAIARTVRDSRALYEKEQLLDGILDSVGDGVFGVDEAGRISFANARALLLLGLTDEAELVGKDAERFFVPGASDRPTATIAWMRKAYAARGFVRPIPREMRVAGGDTIDVTASVYPLRIRDREMGTVVAFREVSRDYGLERQAWWHATHDPGTGVLNRRYFEVQLESELHQMRRTRARHAVLVVAVEPERSNDSQTRKNGATPGFSHDVSEAVESRLKPIAAALVERARSSDIVAYFGLGRFAVLLRDADPGFATAIQADFRRALSQTLGEHAGLSASVGIAVLDETIQSPNEIIALASLAQRIASGSGLGPIRYHLANQADAANSAPADARAAEENVTP